MDFTFTEEHHLFASTVRDILTAECTPAHVRAAWESETGRIDGLWTLLAETGVVGLTAPEDTGGLGMNEVDLVKLMEEAGRAAVPEPLVAHTAVAIPALAEGGEQDLLTAAATAESTITVVNPLVPFALNADTATWLIAEVDGALRHGDIAGVDLTAEPTLDRSRRLFSVDIPHGWGEVLDTDPLRALDRGAVATASQCIGIARHLIEATVAYVSDRYQFGKPVGTYQAVKHHLANAAMAVEFAAPVVAYAAWCVATDDPHRSREVSMAKVLASDAVELAAQQALQCHGAIGYTYEYDLQMWMKRGWALASAWGDAGWHRDRVGIALNV